MKDQDIISEDERHEEYPPAKQPEGAARRGATEAPVGEVKVEGEGEQRNVPLAHFPSGANGTEPAPEMERGKRRLFKRKHISSCHGTYIYDYTCINDAHIRANLHHDNGGLEQHATIWLGEGERCFCYATFNTCSAVKCDYLVRGMIAGLAKRLVYHHKNLIKRKAKWAAAKAAKKGGAK